MNLKSKSVALLKSKEYKLITKFADSFKNKYKFFSNDNKNVDNNIEKKLNKLKKSLEKKGFVFGIEELKSLIYNEIIVLSYEDFKKKIFCFKPQDFKDYINAFLKVFGDDYKEFINYYHFKLLLSEQKIKYIEYTLKDEIMDIKRDFKL